IDETEQAIITQFGEPVGKPVITPGLKVRIPFIHRVNSFPKVLLEWDGDKTQVPTKDKTYIWVDVFARWKIVDPLEYFRNLKNETEAQWKLDNIINSSVRNLVTSNPLIETVRNTNREIDLSGSGLDSTMEKVRLNIQMGRTKLCRKILEQANPKLTDIGIELLDVKFRRINYTDRVLDDVYGRMIAERKQIAEKFRSEGRGESQKIHGEKEKELKRIYSEANKDAEIIKGKADAKAADIYAKAYGRDPEFYSFLKTLDIYKESLDSTSFVVLSSKTAFLKYLKSYTAER
ncbi:MAG: protease modulator HflC, partial [Chitinispirillia bacterium]